MGIKLFKKAGNNPFLKNVFTLLSGATFAQFFPILFTPILTRMYSNTEFGVFFLYVSIFTIISVVVTLRYELSLVLPRDDNEAGALLKTGLILSILISLFFLLILLVGFDAFKNIFSSKSIDTWIYIVPFSCCFFGMSQMFNFWNNRFKMYKHITLAKVTRAIITIMIQIAVWLIGIHSYGLIWGHSIGIVSSFVYYVLVFRKEKNELVLKTNRQHISSLIRKYKDIPIYNTLLSLSSNLSSHLPLIILTRFYGLEIAAFYGLTMRVLSTPLTLIGQSVSQVFYKEVADRVNSNLAIRPLLLKLYKRLFAVSLFPVVILALAGPWLFGLIFGTDWKEAGIYAQILAPFLLLNMINVPISSIITNLNKQKPVLYISLFWLVIKIGGIWAGYYFYSSVVKSLYFFTGASVIYISILLVYYYRISNEKK